MFKRGTTIILYYSQELYYCIMYLRMYICMCVYVHMYLYMCVCMHALCIYVRTYVCVHMFA